MNVHLIKTIVTVAQCSNFAEAAYQLNYTPAVVSKHIASVEKELGVKLFVRGNKASGAEMTAEGRAVIYELIAMQEAWDKLNGTLSMLRDKPGPLKIGTPNKRWSYGEEDIITDYILENPETGLEQIHGYASEFLRQVGAGRLDGAFLVVQGELDDIGFIREFRQERECEFIPVERQEEMYLAVAQEYAANYPEGATFREFAEFDIAFNSDRLSLACGNNMMPFVELSRKYGFELRSTFLDTNDAGVYRLATQLKLAIPSPRCDRSYPGVGYVRLTDWSGCVSSYFVCMKKNPSPALKRFKAAIAARSAGK